MDRSTLRRAGSRVGLLALALLVLAACGAGGAPSATGATPASGQPTAAAPSTSQPAAPASPAGAAPDAKVLRIHVTTYPDSLDPQKLSNSNEISVVSLVYEGLTRLDSNLKPVPAAAERWEFNATNDQITFTLRKGLRYSDGTPLGAAEFRYAIERTCDPRTAGDYQSILFDIVGCEDYAQTPLTDTLQLEQRRQRLLSEGVSAPDPHTLVVRLTHPAPYFSYIAGLWVLFPVKQESVGASPDTWWTDPRKQIGNGPFRLTRLDTDQIAVFEANPDYWGGRPRLDRIEFVYQKGTAVAIEAYKAGQLDIVSLGNDPSQISTLKKDPQLSQQLLIYPTGNTFGVGFNLTKPPFEDKKVREAFAYALDRKTYCELIRNGDCIPTYSWIPPGVAGALDSAAYAFDPDKARQALAESSYGGPARLPEIKLTYSSDDPDNTARMEWVAGQLRDVLGIEATLDPLEGRALNGRRKSNSTYPQSCWFCAAWYQDYPDPQNWISVYWRSDAFARRYAYTNSRLDALSQRADVERDATRRVELYQQANRLLLDDLPALFAYNRANVFLVRPTVTGFRPTAGDAEWPGENGSMLTIDITR